MRAAAAVGTANILRCASLITPESAWCYTTGEEHRRNKYEPALSRLTLVVTVSTVLRVHPALYQHRTNGNYGNVTTLVRTAVHDAQMPILGSVDSALRLVFCSSQHLNTLPNCRPNVCAAH